MVYVSCDWSCPSRTKPVLLRLTTASRWSNEKRFIPLLSARGTRIRLKESVDWWQQSAWRVTESTARRSP